MENTPYDTPASQTLSQMPDPTPDQTSSQTPNLAPTTNPIRTLSSIAIFLSVISVFIGFAYALIPSVIILYLRPLLNITAQICTILALTHLSFAYKNSLPVKRALPIIAAIVVAISGFFCYLSYAPTITIFISYVIISRSMNKPNPTSALTSAAATSTFVVGLIILLGWSFPTFIQHSLGSIQMQGFSMFIYLIYAPIYNVVRLSALTPTVLSIICLIKTRHYHPPLPRRKRDIAFTLIGIFLALSPVFYTQIRRVIGSDNHHIGNEIGIYHILRKN